MSKNCESHPFHLKFGRLHPDDHSIEQRYEYSVHVEVVMIAELDGWIVENNSFAMDNRAFTVIELSLSPVLILKQETVISPFALSKVQSLIRFHW